MSCDKTETAKDLSGYIKKELSLDNYGTIETPLKVFDMKGLSRNTARFFNLIDGLKILESPIYIWNNRTWNSLRELIENDLNDSKKTLNLLKLKPNISDNLSNTMVFPSVVFNANPFDERVHVYNDKPYVSHPLDRDDFEMFLQNIYSFSKGMVLAPDIRYGRIPKNEPHIPKSKKTIEIEDYIKTIEWFVDVLSNRNKKPIFVPIQTNMGKRAIKKVIEHYRLRKYSNIWVNFNDGELARVHLSGFRMILDSLDKNFGRGGYRIYCSHMKKEFTPSISDVKTPSSDILSQFVGADFIGCNRMGGRRPPGEEDIKKQMEKFGFATKVEFEQYVRLSKSRIFDRGSYYCHLPHNHPGLPKYKNRDALVYTRKELEESINKNKFIDSLLKYGEVEFVKNEIYGGNKKIKPYIKNKQMLKNEGQILDDIMAYETPESSKIKPLFDFVDE